jgi:hypothetical protein
MSVTPVSVTFSGTDPDLPLISASSPVTVSFRMSDGKNKDNWSLDVWASSATFTSASCPLVEAHSVTVTCTEAMVGLSGGGGSASCSGPVDLQTSPQTVASGKEDKGDYRPFTVTLALVLNDQWRFRATDTPCTLTLNYRLNVP